MADDQQPFNSSFHVIFPIGRHPEAKKGNEIHRLIITPSKHLYLRPNGTLVYRKKPIEYKLGGRWPEKIEPVVYYLIVDDYSTVLHAETRRAANLALPEDFLFRAWRPKAEGEFFGRPERLIVPKNIFDQPLLNLCINARIPYRHPTSGFEALPHITKEWEQRFSEFANKSLAFDTFNHKADALLREYINNHTGSPFGDTRIQAWKRSVINPSEISDPAAFKSLVNEPLDLPDEDEPENVPSASPLRRAIIPESVERTQTKSKPQRSRPTAPNQMIEDLSKGDLTWAQMTKQLFNNFDFQRLHRILTILDWTWDVGENVFEIIRVPTEAELRDKALELLQDVKSEPGMTATFSGLTAFNMDGMPVLIFGIEGQFGPDKTQSLHFRRFMDSY
jgi:hypothetical protein